MKRWLIVHILGGIVGVWSGVTILFCFSILDELVFTADYCSGIPCSSSYYYRLIAEATISGVLGATLAYVISQRLLHHPIDFLRGLLPYAILGGILWPIIGAVCFIVMINIPPIWSYPPHKADLSFYIEVILTLTLVGGSIGLLIALVRQTQNINQMEVE